MEIFMTKSFPGGETSSRRAGRSGGKFFVEKDPIKRLK